MVEQWTLVFDMHFKNLLPTVLAFIILSCSDSNSKYPSQDMSIEGQLDWQKKFYFKRISEFKKNPIRENKIVFLGNSIIQGGGDWNKRYNLKGIVNRGISGDFTNGILNRLDEIIFYHPISVFLMIGINEFFADNSNNSSINPEYVAQNILKVAGTIKKGSPKTEILISTILPINNEQYINVKNVDYNFLQENYSPSVNDQVEKTNMILKSNKKYTVVDLYKVFADENYNLKSNLSSDGVHLNNTGYDLWVQKTIRLINTLKGTK